MRIRFLALPVLLLGLGLAACGDDTQAPPTGFPDVVLEVALAGHQDTPGRIQVAADRAPTFQDGERRAWSLTTLFARERGTMAARVLVHQAEGAQTELQRPWRTAPEVWVLRANRRGAVQVVLVDPQDPFPAHHGRGGNRGRPGGQARRVEGVARITMIVDPSGAQIIQRPAQADRKQQEAAMLALGVEIDGEARTLDAETLTALDPIAIQGDDGKGERDGWNLRALVRALGGETARLTVLHARDGGLLELDAAAWASAETPVLRLNRRGQLKFHWVGADGKPTAGTSLRDVQRLVLVTR